MSSIQPLLSTIADGFFDRYRYPDWLRAHSRVVGAIALQLAEAHVAAGADVDGRTVALGGYLHDIGKSPLLAGDGRDHNVLGPLVLAAEGLPELAELSRRHPVYAPRDPATAPRTLAEKIVYYADRRGGQRVVTLEERIDEQLARFPELAHLRASDLAMAKAIEADVFRGIALRPGGPGVSVDRARLEKRIGELSAIGGSGTSVTRLGLSPEEQRARDLIGGWLSARGAKVWRDPAANVYGRFRMGRGSGPSSAIALLVGSHIDSVPEGGRFDGALGVLCAVEAVDALLDDGVRFRRPVEVVGWCDEEGARFGIGLFGSCAAFGRLPDGAAQRADRSGVTIADALRAIGESGDPTTAKRDPGEFAAYLELHIEQGPRLAERGIPLGVVSDIVGILHARVTVRGRQDHAGATIMTAREDALAAAAEMVLAVETAARALPDAVGTVGEISVRPGAKNVVPGECVFSLDLRARSEGDRRAARA